jgi:opacity protein-like surface antigen
VLIGQVVDRILKEISPHPGGPIRVATRPAKAVGILTLAAIAALLPSSMVRAEDTKGKWQFGFGLSYFSTTDYIRSNADLAISTGIVDENGLPTVRSVDERPDINILNEPTIKDDFRIDFNASYGLTRWLALEAAVGYYNGPVGDIEYFSEDKFIGVKEPVDAGFGGCGPDMDARCMNFNPDPTSTAIITNSFVPVGEITQIPVHVSGLIRFRPESPFDPYIGLGIGYIMADLKTGSEFNDVAASIGGLRVVTASEGEFTEEARVDKSEPSPGFVPAPPEANVKNAFEWHAAGGVDYYVNERFSFYIDARYVWTSGSVDIRTDGAHQVRFGVEEAGQLLLERRGSVEDPFLWEDTGFWDRQTNSPLGIPCEYADPDNPEQMKSCAGDGLFATEEKGQCVNGEIDTACQPPGTGLMINEDDGKITLLPPGSFDFGERVGEFECAACADDGQLATEDRNDNQILDRFLLYGVDLCSRPQSAGNPICARITTPPTEERYTWPGGCPVTSDIMGDHKGFDEGCPPVPPGTTVTGKSSNDDTSDVYLIQGGRIRLGGFSMGVGFKFTF